MPFKIKKTVSITAPSGNSVQFSGNSLNGNYATSKYLYTPVTTSFDPGTNTPWTIEFWVYPITACAVFNISTSTNWGNSLWISWDSSFFNWGQGNSAGSNPINVNTAASYPANNWYHVSICKDSSYTSRMFINGTQVLSSTYNGSLGSPNRLIVNGQWDNAGYSYGGNCYVSNVRWIKGTGLYTASFSVPTSPLTAITNTQLLICNGPTIVDSSPNNFTITNNNSATVSSTVTPFTAPQSVFKIKKNNPNPTMLTGYGASFDGSNYLSLTGQSLSGTDFTVEAWVYFNTFTTYNSPHVFTFGTDTSNRYNLWRNPTTGKFNLGAINSGTYTLTDGATTPVTGRWYHVAYVRNGNNNYMYIDGIQDATNAAAINSGTSYAIGFMQYGSQGANNLNGYVSNFRVVKGTALYTASFTVPSSPLTAITSCSLLTCNAATIIDSSTNNFTITNNSGVVASSSFTPFSSSLIAPTNYSVAFNGSNQYLTMPSTSSLAAGSGSFTYECWMYPTSVSSPRTMISSLVQLASPGDHGIYIKMQTNSTITGTIIQDNGTNLILTTSGTYALNTWHHVVLTRVGSDVSLFVNGTRTNTGTSNINSTENTIAIGKYYVLSGTVADLFNGYISNARVVIGGTQPYSPTLTTLTVPTTPLTAIANTSLLTCNAATIVDSSTNNLTLTNTGTATVSSTITPFSASVSSGGFKLKQVSYVRPNYMIATGGDLITTSGSYKIHTFTTVGTSSFVVSNAGIAPTVECLLVGGGGGAGYWGGAGGGAGGVVYTASFTVSASSYNVVVGIGGSGSVQNNSNGVNGNNTLFGSLTALGGGGGGSANNPGASAGNSGGSGGGGGSWGGVTSAGGSGLQPASTSGGYGSNGGTSNGTSPYGAGGGGGAGGVGGNAAGSQTGNGGVGITNALLNSALVGQLYSGSYYVGGGGGAGGSSQGSARGVGGAGGGANGAPYGSGSGSNGVANTGGGGGGGQNDPTPAIGGSGGSGVVVIKYRYTI